MNAVLIALSQIISICSAKLILCSKALFSFHLSTTLSKHIPGLIKGRLRSTTTWTDSLQRARGGDQQQTAWSIWHLEVSMNVNIYSSVFWFPSSAVSAVGRKMILFVGMHSDPLNDLLYICRLKITDATYWFAL